MLGGRLSAQHGDEGRWGHALLLRADYLGIGQQHRAVVERGYLGPKKQFASAQHIRVLASVESIAQDQVDELIVVVIDEFDTIEDRSAFAPLLKSLQQSWRLDFSFLPGSSRLRHLVLTH